MNTLSRNLLLLFFVIGISNANAVISQDFITTRGPNILERIKTLSEKISVIQSFKECESIELDINTIVRELGVAISGYEIGQLSVLEYQGPGEELARAYGDLYEQFVAKINELMKAQN